MFHFGINHNFLTRNGSNYEMSVALRELLSRILMKQSSTQAPQSDCAAACSDSSERIHGCCRAH
jgi:hypothetical protein